MLCTILVNVAHDLSMCRRDHAADRPARIFTLKVTNKRDFQVLFAVAQCLKPIRSLGSRLPTRRKYNNEVHVAAFDELLTTSVD